jgi:hypothetical protein
LGCTRNSAAVAYELIGEHKAKMARRWQTGSREQLTPAELVELRKKLEAMPAYELESRYRAVHNACRYEIQGRVPSPAIMQELVTAWRVLRKVAKR